MKEARMHHTQPGRALGALETFLGTPLDTTLARHHEPGAVERHLLDLLRSVAAGVPAYQALLAEREIDPGAIRSLGEYASLPVISKQSYLQRHPLPSLCRDGQLDACDFVAVSSGSTGSPTFWPRFISDELGIATRFEQIFRDSFRADERRTLAVVCFTLGTWVGGMFTAACCRYLASKGYPITVVTPGGNREEIYRAVQQLAPHYDQVVLLGYPPALKDIIDAGRARGVDWAPYRVKLVMAGEVFSEEWRALVGERLGSQDPCRDSAALYGTADAGVLANETPLSICIRRFLASRPEAARQLFGESRMPTLAQYDPLSRYFEAIDRTLIFSGDNGIPLVRYNILDTGGVVPYDEMLAFLAGWGFDPVAELGGPGARGVRSMPFVYVFGRSDFTVSFFGANIYPENITVGLEQPEVSAWVTGKFVLEVREAEDHNPYLSVVVELAPGVEGDAAMQDQVARSILQHLQRLNSEFRSYVPEAYQRAHVQLAPMGDPEHFPAGVKHRYTRRPRG
jgi:phenylacetate-CoA ligase